MSRKHALAVAVVLGVAAVAGTVALSHTLGLGTSSRKAPDALVARRARSLDRFEAALRKQLRRKPPALPAAPAAAPAAAAAAAPAAAPRVVYVRPAPVVVTRHRAGGEHEPGEGREGREGGGEGGGGDD